MKQKKTLCIEFGNFTGEIGREVWERFKREVDDKCKKLERTHIQKSRAVGSREALEEDIVVKALDRFLTPSSTKERLEKETGQNISDQILKVLIHIDEDYTTEELKTMCRERGLNRTGHKKLLAWRLLRDEVEKVTKTI